jgi:hypothetical protein
MKQIAVLASAAIIFAPVASADFPGLAPFVGTWQKHDDKLVIDSNGTGVDTYPDRTECPGCSDSDAPTGTFTFTLLSAEEGVATGSVTATSDPAKHAVGEPVTATISDGTPGKLLQVTIAGFPHLPFCDSDAQATGQCGP